MAYEVWEKAKYERGTGKPESVFYLVDSAYDEVKRLSKGKTHTASIYVPKPSGGNPWGGAWEETILPDIFIVIQKDRLITLKAFGIAGKLLYPKNCARCQNTGNDTSHWGLNCAACGGACQMKV